MVRRQVWDTNSGCRSFFFGRVMKLGMGLSPFSVPESLADLLNFWSVCLSVTFLVATSICFKVVAPNFILEIAAVVPAPG